MPEKVYIITHGEYSDYHIIGASTNKEVAEYFSNKWRGTVEEYDLLTSDDFNSIKNKTRFEVIMDKNGGSKFLKYTEQEGNLITTWEFWRYAGESTLYIYVQCWANDENHAVKIANEIRAQLIASEEWDKEEMNT